MKEVKITEIINGYIVEYWGTPESSSMDRSKLRLERTEVYRYPLKLLSMVGRHFFDMSNIEVSFVPAKIIGNTSDP